MSFDRLMRDVCAGLFVGAIFMAVYGITSDQSIVSGMAGLLLVAAAFGCYEAHQAVKEEQR